MQFRLRETVICRTFAALLWAGLCLTSDYRYFKYAGFFIENVEAAIGIEIANLNIVLPLAISFFTFQQIAYLVDVYQARRRSQIF